MLCVLVCVCALMCAHGTYGALMCVHGADVAQRSGSHGLAPDASLFNAALRCCQDDAEMEQVRRLMAAAGVEGNRSLFHSEREREREKERERRETLLGVHVLKQQGEAAFVCLLHVLFCCIVRSWGIRVCTCACVITLLLLPPSFATFLPSILPTPLYLASLMQSNGQAA